MIAARYFDGMVADGRDVTVVPQSLSIQITDTESGAHLAYWRVGDLRLAGSRTGEIRLALAGGKGGERLVFASRGQASKLRSLVPRIGELFVQDQNKRWHFIGLSTLVLGILVAAYLIGIPLLARHLTYVVPPSWDVAMGDRFADQVEQTFADQFGFEVCESRQDHPGNLALNRFAREVLSGVETPYDVRITVARSFVANAFALPGGRIYLFSELIDAANHPDELAGVLAHEIGHVVHRHTTTQIIATSGTGLLIGLVLGDLTGVSVAAGVGALLVDSSFSRDAERDADRFAAEAANRLGFRGAALGELLGKIAGDEGISGALSILSSHPLTSERLEALENASPADADRRPAFTKSEWKAILDLC